MRPYFSAVTAYLTASDLAELKQFMSEGLGAELTYETTGGGGGLHTEWDFRGARLMIGVPAGWQAGGGGMVFCYVDDVDALYSSALTAGATAMMPPADGEFDEERGAAFTDPWGNSWFLGRHGPGSKHYERP